MFERKNVSPLAQNLSNSAKTHRSSNKIRNIVPALPIAHHQDYGKDINIGNLQFRGGGDSIEHNEPKENDYLELLSKISRYVQKIQENKYGQEVIESFIPTKVRNFSDFDNHKYMEPMDLELDVKKTLFSPDSKSRVMLLVGKTGIGKSFCCEYLRRAILFEWDPEPRLNGSEWWLPIYIDLSRSRCSGESVITETLTQELLLTETEIGLLKHAHRSKSGANKLPKLLFILDGYDQILDSRPLRTDFDCISHNLFKNLILIGPDWENSKVIVTCRENSLSKIDRRDLLFAQLDKEDELPIQGSLVERILEKFTDGEIKAFLKKYIILRDKGDVNQKITFSWIFLEEYEHAMINYLSKKSLKTPLKLILAANMLPDLLQDQNQTQVQEIPEIYFPEIRSNTTPLYDTFIKYTIKSIRETEPATRQLSKLSTDELYKSILIRLHHHALTCSRYHLEPSEFSTDEKEQQNVIDEALISGCPQILRRDEKGIYFRFRALQDYLVARSIEEELMRYSKKDSSTVPKTLLINRKVLMTGSLIAKFLIDAVREKRLIAEDLLNFIKISKISPMQSPFATAAANIVTILNAADYNFSGLDLSNICIPHADMSYGKFEKTNFANADLQCVLLEGACLKNADLIAANLKKICFGIYPDWIDKQKVVDVSIPPNGKHVAVAYDNKIVVLIKDKDSLAFKEVTTLKTEDEDTVEITKCVISSDGKKVLHNRGGIYRHSSNLLLWEVPSRTCHKLKGASGEKTHIQLSADGNSIISYSSGTTTSAWNKRDQLFIFVRNNTSGKYERKRKEKKCGSVTDCKFNPDGRLALQIEEGALVILLNTMEAKFRVRFMRDPKPFYTEKPNIYHYCRFSSNRKQIAFYSKWNTSHIYDFVRRRFMKYVKHLGTVVSNYVEFDGSQLFYTDDRFLARKDIADLKEAIFSANPSKKETRKNPKKNSSQTQKVSEAVNATSIQGKIIAFSEDKCALSFCKIPPAHKLATPMKRGQKSSTNKLNLKGTNINSAYGVSEESINIFRQKGDYGKVDELFMKMNIVNSIPKEITKISLNSRNLSQETARAIGGNTGWVNLEILELQNNSIGDEEIAHIGTNCAWPNLKRLDLSGNKISGKSAMGISNNSTWAKLEELMLGENQIQEEGSNMFTNESWKSLRVLDLHGNKITFKSGKGSAKNTAWTNLHTLNLADNAIGNEGALYLLTETSWPNLTILNLAKNAINATGALALSQNTIWPSIETLNLANNSINATGIAHLRKNSSWITLKTLNLAGNWFSAQGAAELRQNISWVNLQTLNLAFTSMGDDGVIELSKNTSWVNLEILNLGNNSIGDKGITILSQNESWSKLKTLILWKNSIGANGCEQLSKNATWPNLQELNLSVNSIGPNGSKALAKNTSWVNLQSLDLAGNAIGNNGAMNLSKNLSWVNLTTLSLNFNLIEDKGVRELSKNKAWKALKKLELQGNGFDKGVAVVELKKNPHWGDIEIVLKVVNN